MESPSNHTSSLPFAVSQQDSGLFGFANRRPLLFLTFFSLVIAFSFQGTRGLYDPTEGRYAEVSRQMLEINDFNDPILNGAFHFTKPPVYYWTIMCSFMVFGSNEWGARTPSAIFYVLTVLAIFLLSNLLWGKQVGLLSGLIYATSPYPVIAHNIVAPDTLLTLFIVSMFLSYASACRTSIEIHSRWFISLMWLAFGLAFLTKGTAALIPFAALVIWHIWHRPKCNLLEPLGIALFAVVGLGWYYDEFLEPEHSDFFQLFLQEQVIGRLFSTELKRNPSLFGAFKVYTPVLLLCSGAWIFVLFGACSKDFIKNLYSQFRLDSSLQLIASWILLPLIVFIFASSHLPLYLLPIYPAISILLGYSLSKSALNTKKFETFLMIALFSGYAVILLKGGAAIVPNSQNMRELYENSMTLMGESGNRKIVIVNQESLFGLQFYTREEFIHLSLEKKETWADSTLEQFANSELSKSPHRKYFLIMRSRDTTRILRVLTKANLTFDQHNIKSWTILEL